MCAKTLALNNGFDSLISDVCTPYFMVSNSASVLFKKNTDYFIICIHLIKKIVSKTLR